MFTNVNPPPGTTNAKGLSPSPGMYISPVSALSGLSEISASRAIALLRELDLFPRLVSLISSAASLAAGMASPPGTVRNLDLIPPSVTTFSSSRSDDVMAKTLRNSEGSSVPTGIDGLSPSTDFWTRRIVLSAPSCS